MRKNVNKFTDDFQMQVVQEYLTTDISQEELKKKYNFKGNNNIYRWMRKFDLSKPNEEQIELHRAMTKESQKSFSEQQLELEVKTLEEELKRERLKTLALNTMINIAERELKIDIRKKPGAKR
jgi:transposase